MLVKLEIISTGRQENSSGSQGTCLNILVGCVGFCLCLNPKGCHSLFYLNGFAVDFLEAVVLHGERSETSCEDLSCCSC